MRHWLLKFVTVGNSLSNSALATPGTKLSYLVNCSNMCAFLSLRISIWWVYKSVDVIMVKYFLLELLVRRLIVFSHTGLGSDLLACWKACWCWSGGLGCGVLRNLGVTHLQENPFAFLNRSILLLHECLVTLLAGHDLVSVLWLSVWVILLLGLMLPLMIAKLALVNNHKEAIFILDRLIVSSNFRLQSIVNFLSSSGLLLL